MTRDPRLVTDIDREPTPTSDEGRVLALLESRFRQRVPVYEVERAAHLQYSSRVHSARHVYGYVIVNGEEGRTAEGRKRTWFSLIGRLTRSQLAALVGLCREGMRYNTAVAQVFPEAGAYLKLQDREKRKLIRDYPSPPTITLATAPTLPMFADTAIEASRAYRDPEEGSWR